MKFKTEAELLEYTENIIGKTFKEIDSKHLLDSSSLTRRKGLLGQIVETGFYNYPLNNDSKADFKNLGIELKVTGYIKNKNGSLRAKERMKLSTIDFNKIVNETFETSHVLEKCEKMLIIWYNYDREIEAKDFLITNYQLYDMGKDKEIFKNDFEIIKGKVLAGKAHELSEGDTSYLGACTNAQTSADRTTQPYSDILPKPRAYSLKNAYMTGILRENLNTPMKTWTSSKPNTTPITPEEINPVSNIKTKQSTLTSHTSEEIQPVSNIKTKRSTLTSHTPDIKIENEKDSKKYKTVEEYVEDKLKPYFGKTQLEILEEISGRKYTEKIPKNISKMISDELIGKDNELSEKDDLFAKTSFIIKNLPIKEDGTPRERMSFKTISLSEFEEEWEDSFWKNYFEETTLITICYEEKNRSRNGFRILKFVKKITFDENDLDEFKKTYNQIKIAIEKEDVNLLPTVANGFKNQLLEIAPKGVKGDNAYVNFFKRDKTKVAFMISKKLLVEKLKK